MRDREPTTARRCGQLKQQIREAKCTHPESAKRMLLLSGGGYVEYCVDCNRVTEIYEP